MNKIIKNSGKIFISGLLIFSLVGCGKVPVLKNGEDAIVTSNNKNINKETIFFILSLHLYFY